MDSFEQDRLKEMTYGEVITKLENALAISIFIGNKLGEAKYRKALEAVLNTTDFPKVSA